MESGVVESAESWSTVSTKDDLAEHATIITPHQTIPQHLEVEGPISTSESMAAAWMRRFPWLRHSNSRSRRVGFPDTLEYNNGSATYHGGVMESDNPHPDVALHKPSSFNRMSSWRSTTSSLHTHREEDSLADFNEAEWTPPDSSYGAAIPVGGWIPKNIRRLIEGTLIAISVVGLVYLIVTTSIRLTDNQLHARNATVVSKFDTIQSDDDWYISYYDSKNTATDENVTDDGSSGSYSSSNDDVVAANDDDDGGKNNAAAKNDDYS